jgi:hypothetical protein
MRDLNGIYKLDFKINFDKKKREKGKKYITFNNNSRYHAHTGKTKTLTCNID